MGSFSIWHWLVVLLIVVVLFGGGGKISRLMGDFGKGLKNFKKGIKDTDAEEGEADPKVLKTEAGDEAKGDQAAKG